MTGKQIGEAITKAGAGVVVAIITLTASAVWIGSNSLWGTLDDRLEAQAARLHVECDEDLAKLESRLEEMQGSFQEMGRATELLVAALRADCEARVGELSEACGLRSSP